MADTERMIALRAKIKARRAKAAAAKAKEAADIEKSRAAAESELRVEEAVEPEGFFGSFFGRAETIDEAVEESQTGRLKNNQSTDSNN